MTGKESTRTCQEEGFWDLGFRVSVRDLEPQ